MTSTLVPTDEQTTALDGFSSGLSMALDALAGTGKSSTLRMIGKSAPGRRGQYLAFNSAIVREAARTFPANVDCQPDGTLVRIPEPRHDKGRSCGWTEVPIENLRDGDKVVSWNDKHGPVLRKRGRPIQVSKRPYDGPLVVASIGALASRYTPEHPCIVTMGDAFEGQWIVYMMRRGDYFKVGMCSWRLTTGRNGLAQRAQQEGADAFWILSVEDSRSDAALTEVLTQYEWHMPGWCFRSETGIDLDLFWSKINPNRIDAERCLAAYGRDITRPLWSKGQSMKFGQQWIMVAACNLVDGMRMLAVDDSITKGQFARGHSPRRVWRRIGVSREWYSGTVTSLEVVDDHTYIADGILTHNCRTAHSLAFRAVAPAYPTLRTRLDQGRMRGDQIARELGIDPQVVTYGAQRKVLQPSHLAGHVMRAVTRFCQSADPEPSRRHVAYIDGLDIPDPDGTRNWDNNNRIASYLEPFLAVAWADLTDPHGRLRFSHDHYLKLYELSRPRLGVDFLLIDEAQDLSPVMLSIMEGQKDAQLVVVGDANQSVYSWRGSVNAMEIVDVPLRARLTQSFRFGDAVAEVANWCLGHLPTELRVRGYKPVDSRVGPVPSPRSVLCRTNAGAMDVLFTMQTQGRRPCLLGGGSQVASFARAAKQLMDAGSCGHPDLWCFDSWKQVVEYVESDPQGDELVLMVKLVESYGVDVILEALDRMPDERAADVVIATAHAAKGREWESVRLHSDFRTPELSEGHAEEWRLLYVAVTRARLALDVSPCPAFAEFGKPAKPEEPALVGAESAGKGLTDRRTLRRLAEAES